MAYNKHWLTEIDDIEKAGWPILEWSYNGKYKTEKVKYPDRYMQKLFENGVKEVYVTTTKRFTPND